MMKRVIAILLVLVMLLTGCGVIPQQNMEEPKDSDVVMVDPIESTELTYAGMSDEKLLHQVEDLVYTEAINSLKSDEYVVENVQAVFISKEYIDELAFNSQSNIYFGYTLNELNDIFRGSKYVFTLDEDGRTTVKPYEVIEDTSTEQMLKNVAVGTGVILVCVTVSCLTAGSAPAIAAIFAVGAESAEVMALSGGAFGAATAGIVRGIQTGDLNEALHAAEMAGSEGYKWGAISGAVFGGGKEAFALKAATKGGLTMNEVALIQQESQLPKDVIAQLHSMKEYEVYKQASLKAAMVNGRTALVQTVDLNYVTELPDGTKISNLARMQRGLPPIDPASGKAYELHHIGQNGDGTLAMLTQDQHRGKGAFSILHDIWEDSGVDHGTGWSKIVKEFWKYLGNTAASGGTI